MNKRRWIGVGIAVALLGLSVVTSSLKKKRKQMSQNFQVWNNCYMGQET